MNRLIAAGTFSLFAGLGISGPASAACGPGDDYWLIVESKHVQNFRASTCGDGRTDYEGFASVRTIGKASVQLTAPQLGILKDAADDLASFQNKPSPRKFDFSERHNFDFSVRVLRGREWVTLSMRDDPNFVMRYFELIGAQGTYSLRCPISERNDAGKEQSLCPFEK